MNLTHQITHDISAVRSRKGRRVRRAGRILHDWGIGKEKFVHRGHPSIANYYFDVPEADKVLWDTN